MVSDGACSGNGRETDKADGGETDGRISVDSVITTSWLDDGGTVDASASGVIEGSMVVELIDASVDTGGSTTVEDTAGDGSWVSCK